MKRKHVKYSIILYIKIDREMGWLDFKEISYQFSLESFLAQFWWKKTVRI